MTVLAALAPRAAGVIVVELHPRAGGAPTTTQHAGAEPIEVEIDDTIRRVNIYSTTPAVEDIGPVILTGTGGQQVYVIIGDGDHPTFVPSPAARDLAGLVIERGNVDVVGNVSGDIRGAVSVPRIFRFDVDGVVRSPVEQTAPGDMWMEVGGVGAGGAVRSLAGDVHRLGVAGDCLGDVRAAGEINFVQIAGDLRGDVIAEGGPVRMLEVGGTAGEAAAWVRVRSPSHVLARFGTAYADIEAGVGGGDGRVREFATTAGGFTGRVVGTRLDHPTGADEPLRIAGDFDGTMVFTHSMRRDVTIEGDVTPGSVIDIAGITRLEPGSSDEHWGALRIGGEVAGSVVVHQLQRNGLVEIGGDVSGVLRIGEWFDARDFRASVTVGGALTGSLNVLDDVAFPVVVGGDAPGQINIEGALTEPMLINAAGLAGTVSAGQWIVNGVLLRDAPWYAQGVSGELGGALVARAPYAVHRERSFPRMGAVFDEAPCHAPPHQCGVVLRFYGPVSQGTAGGAGADVVVQRRPIGASVWTDVSGVFVADFFYGGADEVRVFPLGVARFEEGYAYRLRPRASVRSVGAAGDVGAEQSVWLEFQIGSATGGCGLADVTTTGSSNGVPDGVIDLSDFSVYLSLWSASDARADITQTGQCEPGNGGDGVDLSDFSCYLTLWSAGCP